MEGKICSKCSLFKEYNQFGSHIREKDGYRKECKLCRKAYDSLPHRIVATKLYNKSDSFKKSQNKYLKSEKGQKAFKLYRTKYENTEKRKVYKLKYNQSPLRKVYRLAYNSSENGRLKTRQYQKIRRINDLNFRLSQNLRSRLNMAIKNSQKFGSAIRDLGCSVGEFKAYLESKFQPGMTWENYGIHGWHIDHIKPLVSFELSSRDEFLKACHYTNLQPLWASDNIRKSDQCAPM